MRTVLEVYCEARQRVVDGLLFLFRGKLVHYDETPATVRVSTCLHYGFGTDKTILPCDGFVHWRWGSQIMMLSLLDRKLPCNFVEAATPLKIFVPTHI